MCIVATGKTKKLWAEHNAHMLSYFEETIAALYFNELVNHISKPEPIPILGVSLKPKEASKESPPISCLCFDSMKYLGELYNPLICALSIIKNDIEVFSFIVEMIDRNKGLNENTLSFLANDIVLFLLADFTSPENYAAHCMTLFAPLIEVFLCFTIENIHRRERRIDAKR